MSKSPSLKGTRGKTVKKKGDFKMKNEKVTIKEDVCFETTQNTHSCGVSSANAKKTV